MVGGGGEPRGETLQPMRQGEPGPQPGVEGSILDALLLCCRADDGLCLEEEKPFDPISQMCVLKNREKELTEPLAPVALQAPYSVLGDFS